MHAWRRDRTLSSGPQWRFDPTLSGFEEGFAQAVSYEAMTELARRAPSLGLSQRIYQSSNEWDYDFQNVPELRTRDFWSDSGGMLLYWTRYEMAAAAIAKIAREHPGFYLAFNAEYYRRLNLDPLLTPSRDLVKDLVRTVAPTIEGRPAAQWIDAQNIFDCADHPGRKVWLSTQHYPAPADYFIFNRIYFYETFANGSDWAAANGSGGWDYYRLNGSSGTAALRASGGAVVWQAPLRITPTDNPPVYNGFGSEELNLTTQATNLPWPGGDASRFVTGLLSFELYRLSVQFTSGTTVSSDSWRVIGAPIRNAAGVFGGIVGASGGTISLNHRSHPAEPAGAGRERRLPGDASVGEPSGRRDGARWTPTPGSSTSPTSTRPATRTRTFASSATGARTAINVSLRRRPDGRRLDERPAARAGSVADRDHGTGRRVVSHPHAVPRLRQPQLRRPGRRRARARRRGDARPRARRAMRHSVGRAVALSANVTVTEPAATGSLVLYPGDASVPDASTIAFRAGPDAGEQRLLKVAGDGTGTVGSLERRGRLRALHRRRERLLRVSEDRPSGASQSPSRRHEDDRLPDDLAAARVEEMVLDRDLERAVVAVPARRSAAPAGRLRDHGGVALDLAGPHPFLQVGLEVPDGEREPRALDLPLVERDRLVERSSAS